MVLVEIKKNQIVPYFSIFMKFLGGGIFLKLGGGIFFFKNRMLYSLFIITPENICGLFNHSNVQK